MLSIVIPAFNEEQRLGHTLACIVDYCTNAGSDYEVIVVDDGSSDETARVADGFGRQGVRVERHPRNRGKGAAVRTGVGRSGGDEVLISDADLSTPIEDIELLRGAISVGADVAIGSRGLPESRITKRQPFYREGMGKTFNVFVRVGLGWSIRDTQCGFKLFRGDAARSVFARVRENGFGFDVEALHIALRSGLRVSEVPVRWHNSPDSRVHIVRSSASMLAALIRVIGRERGGAYGAT
jgi:dolichyl-phosphate beta-glucosyltransferase